ncbi:roadblock/LC7 domain-containing protein [Meiothermus taiwanensis]|jgi:predicted regulator of Ras-like GTPase activity (Roadblock/LC7/MglB family)|uniref:Roadblock/LC7 domain protein n=2 Tax=Meiothermus taiwanensis TaxID=172827 RepID=A0A399E4H0_9DEIN|nr:roadblock/LC7 domain-containing protein [Meiothermus taiwanensis]AWR87008.1 Roadblock/LC7 family protein [Meiothermus taiwanensis WR-220]KIQ54952.1 dynein regulation protein LC7 [Meiothermus taiwanensis]KZK14644.1 dynein regulation protein LC7 [Meiothermus taiwanensis]RIH77620.1 Roadblock/LC7 domain protein [Meiothermus taiwanensis]
MIQELIGELQATKGVVASALVAEDGFVVESLRAEQAPDIDFLGSAASTALASARALAQELERGEVEEVMVEYPEGPVLLVPLEGGYLLVVLIDSMQSLGRVRFQLKKSIPRLQEALS